MDPKISEMALAPKKPRQPDVADLTWRILRHQTESLLRGTMEDVQLFDRLRIFPPKSSAEVLGANDTPLGSDEYYFDLGEGFKKKVRVRLLFTRPLQVQVHFRGTWTHLSQLIKSLPRPEQKRISRRKKDKSLLPCEQEVDFPVKQTKQDLWDAQWRWWKLNGKIFPFGELPRELRDAIYSFSFGEHQVQLYPKDRCRNISSLLRAEYAARNPHGGFLGPVNRQFRQESLEMLVRETCFLVEYKATLRRFAEDERRDERGFRRFAEPNAVYRPLYTQITKLELGLSHIGYFELFGFYFNEEDHWETSWQAVRVLRNMRLRDLEFYVNCPLKASNTAIMDGACQKIACEWIFEAAFPWVRGQPVMFTGYIKKFQKDAFEAKAKEARAEFLEWRERYGGGEGTLVEWDEWEYDGENGGVRVEGFEVEQCVWEEDEGESEEGMGGWLESGRYVDGGKSYKPESLWPKAEVVEREWPFCTCANVCDLENWTSQ